jgi:hypothetical protein
MCCFGPFSSAKYNYFLSDLVKYQLLKLPDPFNLRYNVIQIRASDFGNPLRFDTALYENILHSLTKSLFLPDKQIKL